MLTPRYVALVAAAAGALAAIPLSKGLACDNDRFPCPVIEAAPTQDSVEAEAAEPVPQQAKKKPAQAAQKPATPKGDRNTAQAPAHVKPSKHAVQGQASPTTHAAQRAGDEQTNALPAPAVQVASPVPVLPEQLRDSLTVGIESTAAPTASANEEGTGGTAITATSGAQQLAAAGDFKLARAHEVVAPVSTSAGWSWLYVLVLLGGVLAAVTTVCWFRPHRRGALAHLHKRFGRLSTSASS
jgi:hypothetical protein